MAGCSRKSAAGGGARDPWAWFDRMYAQMLPEINLVLDCRVQSTDIELPVADSERSPGCSGSADKQRILPPPPPPPPPEMASPREQPPEQALAPACERSGKQVIVVRERPYIHAAENIRRWIAEGRLPAGRPLPPVYALAHALKVDKNTVTRAVRLLVNQGVVCRPPAGAGRGRRAIVASPRHQTATPARADSLEVKLKKTHGREAVGVRGRDGASAKPQAAF